MASALARISIALSGLVCSLAVAQDIDPSARSEDGTATALVSGALVQDSTRPRVLFLTYSGGYTHGVVRRVERGKRALAERQLATAARHRFIVDSTQDCSAIRADNLARYAGVVFYTTGELPLDDTQRNALMDFVAQGGGFSGIHPATDTFYDYPAYGEMIGGYFDGHPWHQEVNVVVEEARHPATTHLGAAFRITDEIYQFKNWSRANKTVLARLDNDSVEVEKGKRADRDYAIAWTSETGKGRVFYTSLGHRPEVWADPRFLQHVVGGIGWTIEASLSAPPVGAKVLFDGNGTDAWRHPNGDPCAWQIVDGALEVEPGKGSLVTRETFGDHRLHLEFRIPISDRPQGQGKGNSGAYVQRRYEVQILDSFGRPPEVNGCGSLYSLRAPNVNACLAPDTWQTYDIDFTAARFDGDTKIAAARMTVYQNGVRIHDDVELPKQTGAGQAEGPEPMPLLLQDHGNRVQFRNVWVAAPAEAQDKAKK